MSRHAVRVAALFAGAGLLSRFTFRRFETRWQIVIFWGLAAAYHLVVRPMLGRPVSFASLWLDLAVVAVAIIAMKVMIEGI